MGSTGPNIPKSYPPFADSGSLKPFKCVALTTCLGSEFRDVQVKEWLQDPNSDNILRDLSLLLARRGVVFFRNQQNLDDSVQKELCRRLNELSGAPKENTFHRHPLNLAHGEDENVEKVDPERIRQRFLRTRNGIPQQRAIREWHTDSSYERAPPSYTALRLEEVPETGGDTLWASGYEIYDRLTKPYKRFFESLTVEHKAQEYVDDSAKDPSKFDAGPRGAPANVGLEFTAHHPMVRTHPLTGWKSVYGFGHNCSTVDECTKMESAQIMDKIARLIVENHELQVRFRWESTSDLAIWDNRCTFHAATKDHFEVGRRIGWRSMVIGEVPFLDPKSKSRKEATGGWPYELVTIP